MAGPPVPVGAAGSNGPTGPRGAESPLLELTSIATNPEATRSPAVSTTCSRPRRGRDAHSRRRRPRRRVSARPDEGTHARSPTDRRRSSMPARSRFARSRAEAQDAAQVDVVGLGISSPGPVDPWRGVVLQTPNMGPDFHDVPIAAELGEPPRAAGLPGAGHERRRSRRDDLRCRPRLPGLHLPDRLDRRRRSDRLRAAASSTAPTGPPASWATPPSPWRVSAAVARSVTWRRSSAGGAMARRPAEAIADGASPFLAARAAEKGVDAHRGPRHRRGRGCRRRGVPRHTGARPARLRRCLRRFRRRTEPDPDRGRRRYRARHRAIACSVRLGPRSPQPPFALPEAVSRSSTPSSARTSAWPAVTHS